MLDGAQGTDAPEVVARMGVDDEGEDAQADHATRLPTIRRIEALGFRAWPAANSLYDGSWLVRLTAGHPSRRLNSVNPLDPMDSRDIDTRLERLGRRFVSYDRPLVIRVTPLAPPALTQWCDRQDWVREGETMVMTADVAALDLDDALDHLPLKDVGRFVDADLAVRPRDRALKSGLTEVLSAIRPPTGLFVLAGDDEPVATALCVHDGDYAGVFEVATKAERRRNGFGRTITRAALRWARSQGARRVWLQVETDNEAALALYGSLGFTESYRYHYRASPQSAPVLDAAEELI